MAEVATLETARLRLRPWRASDRAPFAALNADPRVMEFLPWILTPAESDALADRIVAGFEAHGFGLWAVEVPGIVDFAGFIGLSVPSFSTHFTPCVEIGWRLATSVWHRGYATEGAAAALAFAFERARLSEVVSFTVPANRPSWSVMERLGMHRDPRNDFDHPNLPAGHRLQRHVLYRIAADESRVDR